MNWQDRLAVSLLDSLWQCCVVAATVLGLEAIFRPQSPKVRYWLQFVGLFAMVGWPAQSLIEWGGHPNGTPVYVATAFAGTLTGRVAGTDLHRILVWLWFAGVLFMAVRWLAGYAKIFSERRNGTESSEWSAWVSARVRARLVITREIGLGVAGWLRPVIFVPAEALTGLDRPQLEALLYHEFAHIQRHDYFFNVLQTVIDTLLFFHPAEWWISRRVRQEREYCCDDLAAQWCGDAGTYARALLTLQETRDGWMPAATGGSLRQRIARITGRREMQTSRTFAGLGSAIAAAALAVAMLHGAPQATGSKSDAYTKWVDQDVVYIIAPEERAAFLRLNSDQEKDHFIQQFWERRGEAVKKEHYRRIAYTNQKFTSKTKDGWETERGKTYILNGPPAEIETHPAERKEQWLYRDPSGSTRILTFTIE